MAKIKAWEAAARRSVLGKKHEMSTLESYWFKPRKYAVRATEEINAASLSIGQRLPPSLLKKISTLYDDQTDETEVKVTGAQLLEVLEPDELQETLLALNGSGEIPYDLQVLILKNGIGEHNFTDDPKMQVATDVVDDALVESILGFPEQAAEMIEVIQGHNSPLTEGTSSTSKTSPNGSTKKPTSGTDAKTGTTDETPSS